MYSFHLFLISSASVRSIPFLSFIESVFAWNVPLISLIFLKRFLVFPILLISSISLHWLLRKAFLSLLAILWNSAFKWDSFLFSFAFCFSSLHSYLCTGGLRGATPHSRSGGAAVRRYPSSKVRSSSCALLEQLWRDTPRRGKRNPSKTIGFVRGHQRADTLIP